MPKSPPRRPHRSIWRSLSAVHASPGRWPRRPSGQQSCCSGCPRFRSVSLIWTPITARSKPATEPSARSRCSSCWTRISALVRRPLSTVRPLVQIHARRLCVSRHCTIWASLLYENGNWSSSSTRKSSPAWRAGPRPRTPLRSRWIFHYLSWRDRRQMSTRGGSRLWSDPIWGRSRPDGIWVGLPTSSAPRPWQPWGRWAVRSPRSIRIASGPNSPTSLDGSVRQTSRSVRTLDPTRSPSGQPRDPPDHMIPPDELVVGSRDGCFYLRWPARDAEVIACTGHMLNNMQAPDVCRFLDDLRRDGKAQFTSFDCGPAAALPVLPRIQVGRIVLSPARWRVDLRVRSELALASPAAFFASLRKWRAHWLVPRYVYLSFGDNRLLLDLDDKAQADQLRVEIRRLGEDAQLLLREALPAPEHAWVGGSGGHFVTELMVPLVLRPERDAPAAAPPRSRPLLTTADRIRPPGSDWLFTKLYGPRTFEDDLLIGPVAELCQQAVAMGAADDWFFIRYADSDPHLRIRFRGRGEHLIGDLFPQVCGWAQRLLDDGLCTRLCFDTYDRELERFGGTTGTAAAEAIFGADSRAVIEMLRLSRDGLLGMDMTFLAVLSIDDLLTGL